MLVDGRPFLVKGIYYGPWRPGTGPNKGYPFPVPELIDSDLALIRQLNANTIAIYDPPGYVLDLAEKHGLKVLCTFSLNFYAFGGNEFAAEREKVRARVNELKDKPALLGWILGNEVPVYAIEQRGTDAIEQGLAELYGDIKQLDSNHPVTHSNWPPTKDLKLDFLDFVSFNLYPLWPPEVVAQGYGNYIKNVLQPIAGSKPLLMTEFGVNRIEAGDEGQARLVKQCWHDLLGAGACGGVVFEFADQWWKNYDNPLRLGNWWHRTAAPDDEKQHDQDPEEHYGLVTADRQPKPAFHVVRNLYDEPAVAALPAPSAVASRHYRHCHRHCHWNNGGRFVVVEAPRLARHGCSPLQRQ
ncbi:MAG TPA: glycoside hydrolase family 2 TIM barrel-domain containing protein, partial [Tepidisphaeraceae bacterium]|nr:glycoside hydrolase family 2 TIM barrel-domain containing protein [Tepidisphaeraceae bacterium]